MSQSRWAAGLTPNANTHSFRAKFLRAKSRSFAVWKYGARCMYHAPLSSYKASVVYAYCTGIGSRLRRTPKGRGLLPTAD